MGDKINANTFGAHEFDHLLHLIDKALGGVFKQQMGFIEEEDEAGLVDIAGFGKGFEDFGEEPQEEGGIKLWRVHELGSIQHIHKPTPIARGSQEIMDVEGGFTKKVFGTLFIQHHQRALDGAERDSGDIAIIGSDFAATIRQFRKHGAQVFEIEKGKPLLIGNAKGDVECTFLGFR